ncbi:MAG: SDR family oxidoreductase [Thermomicrobiales bacterium]
MGVSLVGKRALVTGASRSIGIGAALCRAFAKAGADVAFTHWTAYDTGMYGSADTEPADLLAELTLHGVNAIGVEFDLSSPTAGVDLFDLVMTELGPIDILVNNAAFSTHDSWDTLSAETVDAHHQVNARATALLTVEFARRFQAADGGRVINFSSGQHLGPMPNELSYAMSKGAIIAFSTSIAPDLARKGITVNVVNPGPTDTGWMSDELRELLAPQLPMGRVGLPEDIAQLVTWLASDDARWITGQVINSEGGFTRG